MILGTVMPVWKEWRYLPLVIEQMLLCPGPKLIVWQDQPLYWLGNGPAPSGHQHEKTARVLESCANEIEVMKITHAPVLSDEFGGFKWIQQMAYEHLRSKGADLIFWQDSDWLFDLEPLKGFFRQVAETPVDGKLWSVPTQHYWRDFEHTMSTSPVTIAYPWNIPSNWSHYEESDMRRLESPMLYHAAYVLSDAEMYDKVHSWGHAPLFKDRQFYEKEWIGGDDSQVKPEIANHVPPIGVVRRLINAEAFL